MSRQLFNDKIGQMVASQGKNKQMFSKEEYKAYVEKLKQISQPTYDMEHEDHYLIRRFKLLRVEVNGKIHERLIKPGPKQLR